MRLKTYIFLFILFAFWAEARCQKEGNNWVSGYSNNDNYTGGTLYDFNSDSLLLFSFNNPLFDMQICPSVISDSSGNLLFYSEGCHIVSKNHQIMPNGNVMGFSGFGFNSCLDLSFSYSSFFLKNPIIDSIYYFFRNDLDENYISIPYLDVFGYSIINSKANGGLGDVITKDNILLSSPDSTSGGVYAVKHANGRDWWIIKPSIQNFIHTFLLNPLGINHIEKQKIVTDTNYFFLFSGSNFSPDGTKFASLSYSLNYDNIICCDLFNFDRCSGQFSKGKRINCLNTQIDTNSTYGVVEFSPNSRLIYIARSNAVFQFDSETDSISLSQTVIANYDGFMDEFGIPSYFYSMRLAPNNKIYLTSPSSKYIHEIESPNEFGVNCGFIQRKYQASRFQSSALPYLPNYKLGPIDGSVCDSLGIDNPIAVEEQKPEPNFSIYPNPAKGHFFVRSEQNQPCQIQVINALGQLALKAEIKQGKGSVKVNIPPGLQGLFVVEIYQNNQIKLRGKLVVEGE